MNAWLNGSLCVEEGCRKHGELRRYRAATCRTSTHSGSTDANGIGGRLLVDLTCRCLGTRLVNYEEDSVPVNWMSRVPCGPWVGPADQVCEDQSVITMLALLLVLCCGGPHWRYLLVWSQTSTIKLLTGFGHRRFGIEVDLLPEALVRVRVEGSAEGRTEALSIDEERESNYDVSIEEETESNYDVSIEEETESNYDVSIEEETESNYDVSIEEETESNYDVSIEEETESNYDVSIEEEMESNYDGIYRGGEGV
ncbi:unnamed protein product [Gadus morhua 'NCC']